MTLTCTMPGSHAGRQQVTSREASPVSSATKSLRRRSLSRERESKLRGPDGRPAEVRASVIPVKARPPLDKSSRHTGKTSLRIPTPRTAVVTRLKEPRSPRPLSAGSMPSKPASGVAKQSIKSERRRSDAGLRVPSNTQIGNKPSSAPSTPKLSQSRPSTPTFSNEKRYSFQMQTRPGSPSIPRSIERPRSTLIQNNKQRELHRRSLDSISVYGGGQYNGPSRIITNSNLPKMKSKSSADIHQAAKGFVTLRRHGSLNLEPDADIINDNTNLYLNNNSSSTPELVTDSRLIHVGADDSFGYPNDSKNYRLPLHEVENKEDFNENIKRHTGIKYDLRQTYVEHRIRPTHIGSTKVRMSSRTPHTPPRPPQMPPSHRGVSSVTTSAGSWSPVIGRRRLIDDDNNNNNKLRQDLKSSSSITHSAAFADRGGSHHDQDIDDREVSCLTAEQEAELTQRLLVEPVRDHLTTSSDASTHLDHRKRTLEDYSLRYNSDYSLKKGPQFSSQETWPSEDNNQEQ